MEVNKLDINKFCKQLENLSLFELSRLNSVIYRMTKDEDRILSVKRSIKTGMMVSYFNSKKNKLIDCVILQINITKLKVRDLEDDLIWTTSFGAINLDGIEINPIQNTNNNNLDKFSLHIGDRVGFQDKGCDVFGIIKKLNPKTAVIELNDGHIWHVYYNHLFLVTDGISINTNGSLLIEGKVTK